MRISEAIAMERDHTIEHLGRALEIDRRWPEQFPTAKL